VNDRGAAAAGWVVRLYTAALSLYPIRVRQEYSGEMLAVFSLKADDAARQGAWSLLCFASREARDLPWAILRSYAKERRAKMETAGGTSTAIPPMKAWKVAAVFVPFALALVLTVLDEISGVALVVLAFGLFALTLAIWIAGLATHSPVWTLPSLGMLAYFFYFYFFKILAQSSIYVVITRPLFHGWPDELGWKILLLVLLVLVTLGIIAMLLLIVTAWIPAFRRWVCRDWTQLSFFLYGLAILPMFMNDEYHHLAIYQGASMLVLAAGAGLYLKTESRWRRVLPLVAAAVISQALAMVALYQSIPLEKWSSELQLTSTDRIWEALQPWGDPFVALLIFPAFIAWIPWRNKAPREAVGQI
jgi:hypothetical protein